LGGNLENCVDNCLKLDFSDFEIIVLPDNMDGVDVNRGVFANTAVRIIPTGAISPPKKRDIGVRHSRAEFLAFIDDDAYPTKDWLKNAILNFNDNDVAAVAGPAVTPDSDSFLQKASGIIYASILVSAGYTYRYLPKAKREVNDYPSCNLIVRKAVLDEVGGFNTNFWPGEDTKLCLDITRSLCKKIIYDPKVLVYHHRRKLFLPHLRQVANYGLHRGYFVKRYPGTSLKIVYFIPGIFVLGLVIGAFLSGFSHSFKIAYLTGLSLYIILVFIFSISRNLFFLPFVFLGIILTHITYGVYFLKGLLSKRLKEE